MVRQQLPEQYLKRQERKIKRIGDYSGSIKPPTFDMNNPQPYPYSDFSRGGLERAGLAPATVDEWRAWFANHTQSTYVPLIQHTLRAHFAEGVDYSMTVDGARNPLFTVEGAIDVFYKCKLVIAPWNLDWRGRPFWGRMDSEAKARARQLKGWADASAKRHDDGVKRRASLKAGEDKKKTHQAHYMAHRAERADEGARERGEPAPKKHERGKKLREWDPKKLEKCPDCGFLAWLVDFEHAKGGSHNGELRCSCCWRDNTVARADYDTANDIVYRATGRDMTAAEHDALVDLDLAFARPHAASAAALQVRAWAQRAAMSARVPAREAIMNAPRPERNRRDTDRFVYAEVAARPQTGSNPVEAARLAAKRKAAKPAKRVVRARK